MTDKSFAFVVRGLPQPQGSARAFNNPKTGRAFIVSKSRNVSEWRQAIKTNLTWEWRGPPIDGPVGLGLIFVFPRPKSLKKGRVLHTTRPDGSKLLRAVEDAMTGVAYTDDKQVQSMVLKVYGDEPGVHIYICELEDTAEALMAFRLECADREFALVKRARG